MCKCKSTFSLTNHSHNQHFAYIRFQKRSFGCHCVINKYKYALLLLSSQLLLLVFTVCCLLSHSHSHGANADASKSQCMLCHSSPRSTVLSSLEDLQGRGHLSRSLNCHGAIKVTASPRDLHTNKHAFNYFNQFQIRKHKAPSTVLVLVVYSLLNDAVSN